LSKTTRPDIAFAVGVPSRFMSYPEQDHMRAAKGLLRYLRTTNRLGVMFGASDALQGYVEADWVGATDRHRSTSGSIFTLNGGTNSWPSKH